jgi:hypothetical protein
LNKPARLNKFASLLVLCLAARFTARGHEVITTKLTWSKEVSRIVYARCAQCHRPAGQAFSLLTYDQARPWAKAIQEQVLTRQMPPWNAVKGFGDFRHDQGLAQEEIATISSWVEGGSPEGDPNHLPPLPRLLAPPARISTPALLVRHGFRLPAPRRLRAIEPVNFRPGDHAQLVAIARDGEATPLIWLRNYSPRAVQQYQLAEPFALPAGTRLEIHAPPHVAFRLR